MIDFWKIIDSQLDAIEREQTNTFAGIVAIMPSTGSAAPAFFGGSGGDRSLFSALAKAGWVMTWAEADYHYTARHPETGETITYQEGDIYPGDRSRRNQP